MGALTHFKNIAPYRTSRNITIEHKTRYKLNKPCSICGNIGGIIAGTPDILNVTIPLSEEEHNIVAEIIFYIEGCFEIKCNNGLSHIATGVKYWTISLKPNYLDGPFTTDHHFEKALADFIPHLIRAARLGYN